MNPINSFKNLWSDKRKAEKDNKDYNEKPRHIISSVNNVSTTL